ncbi:carboxypeptidase-like regulatory domain-containing protein [Chitinophaga sp. S165]|uniref:carboxypeptidase-like regulatory domain-containing protein n=1 Tax=Chitinophaga sp. S165 TaxID=2135462 RepID=UPI000D9EAE86|nr:carboxypeptidase-like regulatory domain-containing protein [Chitinophaga sp. S165]PWV48152.1 hypothetical protein C7475_10758 [Chitinophaga sp. S165]
MTSKILFSLCCIAAVCFMMSCKKDPPPEPEGIITGNVIVYDSTGTALTDHSGVIVTIDSLGLKDTTDASGAYNFNEVAAGTYNFSYSKAGYGTYRIIGQVHAGGTQATELPDADVGQIYYGPLVDYVTYMGFGSPDNHQIYPYALFLAPMQVPTAFVLYFGVNGPSKTDFVTSTRDYLPTNDYPTEYFNFNKEIDPGIIYGDTTLLNADGITFSLAFDNPRDIHYVDEQGRFIYPCTSPILGYFTLHSSTFTPPGGGRVKAASSAKAGREISLRARHQ